MASHRAAKVRVQAMHYRNRLRERGLRPVTFWVPDVSDPAALARLQARSRALAQDPQEQDVLAWGAGIADPDGWR